MMSLRLKKVPQTLRHLLMLGNTRKRSKTGFEKWFIQQRICLSSYRATREDDTIPKTIPGLCISYLAG